MSLRFAPGLHTALLIFMLTVSAARANTPEQIFSQVSPSVVVVDVFNAEGKLIGLGSGVVIGAGQVITNCHVAQEGDNLQVRQSSKTFKATLQFSDPDRDLCQLSAPDLQATSIILGTAKKLMVGQRVYAIGAPQGREQTLSEGLISSLRPYEGSQYIQTSAAISPGSSGGGLFDDQGRLIGITTFYLTEGQSLNFAMPVDWISELPKRAQAGPVVTKESGLDAFVRAYILRKEKEGPSFLDKAEVMRKDKDWHKLIELAQQWVKNGPEDDTSWFYLANAFANIEQYDQAIQAYRESLRIEPADASVWIELGKVYANIKQYDKAITAYLEALRIQPTDISKEAYKFVKVGEPFFLRGYYYLGDAYMRTNQYDQSVQAFREALRIQPEDADAWRALGFAYYFQGQRDKVREIYQTLRKLDPAMAKTYFNALMLP